MSKQTHRNATGGLIDRKRELRFKFDGKSYSGYEGDTLASALLANGVHLIGRSFKYHRPRGVMCAGVDEPNALVQVRTGARREPNTRATVVELFDGLVASSQNCFPSRKFDFMAINSHLSPLLSAGFYYKTFMWPPKFWTQVYERIIRHAAGLGKACDAPDPDHYTHRHAHCDLLVIGAGPSGLMAARAAAALGVRVMLLDDQPLIGGSLNRESDQVDGVEGAHWAASNQKLCEEAGIQVLTRTCAFGYYDHNVIGALQRVGDHLIVPGSNRPRQRMWLIRPKRVLIATGAIERPGIFGNNDLPGIMLASAARAYSNQYAVSLGQRALIATNNNDAYRTAFNLQDAGMQIAGVVDTRAQVPPALVSQLQEREITLYPAQTIGAAHRSLFNARVQSVSLVSSQGQTLEPVRIECDLVCTSGGWNPSVHLHSQSGAKPRYEPELASFVPGDSVADECSVGGARGCLSLQGALDEGWQAGVLAAKQLGFKTGAKRAAPKLKVSAHPDYAIAPYWLAPTPHNRSYKQFLDFQNDVCAKDIAQAHQEGYDSAELVKRYTTQGMATDQGKVGNVNALAVLAQYAGEQAFVGGTTSYRPPYVPIALGALAGDHIGGHFLPTRYTPLHDWHTEQGAIFVEAGMWLRARYYPQAEETLRQCYVREANNVRDRVSLIDVSTLGKIDVQGPDAAEFINRLYINNFRTLPVGRVRYGVMLREDGLVFDDGTCARLGEQHYLVSTTTANAAAVLAHMEHYHQCVWPELSVVFCSVTDQWAGIAVAGPQSRALLAEVLDIDLSHEAFPFMAVGDCKMGEVPMRLFRISFSGELAYELNVPAGYAQSVWQDLMRAGEPLGVGVYGTEALGTLRIEKGHVTATEIDGRTNADDLGFGRMAKMDKDFIGKHMWSRAAQKEAGRLQLVGLRALDGNLRAGAHLVESDTVETMPTSQGHITAITYSPSMGVDIALGLLRNGASRHGELLQAYSPIHKERVPITVCHPIFVDPEGARVRG